MEEIPSESLESAKQAVLSDPRNFENLVNLFTLCQSQKISLFNLGINEALEQAMQESSLREKLLELAERSIATHLKTSKGNAMPPLPTEVTLMEHIFSVDKNPFNSVKLFLMYGIFGRTRDQLALTKTAAEGKDIDYVGIYFALCLQTERFEEIIDFYETYQPPLDDDSTDFLMRAYQEKARGIGAIEKIQRMVEGTKPEDYEYLQKAKKMNETTYQAALSFYEKIPSGFHEAAVPTHHIRALARHAYLLIQEAFLVQCDRTPKAFAISPLSLFDKSIEILERIHQYMVTDSWLKRFPKMFEDLLLEIKMHLVLAHQAIIFINTHSKNLHSLHELVNRGKYGKSTDVSVSADPVKKFIFDGVKILFPEETQPPVSKKDQLFLFIDELLKADIIASPPPSFEAKIRPLLQPLYDTLEQIGKAYLAELRQMLPPDATVSYRLKEPHSILMKMLKEKKRLVPEITDIIGFHIVIKTREEAVSLYEWVKNNMQKEPEPKERTELEIHGVKVLDITGYPTDIPVWIQVQIRLPSTETITHVNHDLYKKQSGEKLRQNIMETPDIYLELFQEILERLKKAHATIQALPEGFLTLEQVLALY